MCHLTTYFVFNYCVFNCFIPLLGYIFLFKCVYIIRGAFLAQRQTFQKSTNNNKNFSTVWTTSARDNTSPPVSCVAGRGAVGVLCHWPLTAWVSRAARAPTLIPLCSLLRTAALVTELQEEDTCLVFKRPTRFHGYIKTWTFAWLTALT